MKVRSRYLMIMAGVWIPCLVVMAAFWIVVVRPQLDRRHDLEARVDQARMHYARAVEAAKSRNQIHLTEQVKRLQDRVADFLLGFDEAPKLAFEMGNLARETRLESFGMKPTNAQTSAIAPECERLVEKQLNVSFLAGFPQFAAFLNALERHRPVVFIETFAINRPLETDREPRVDMKLAVLVEKPHEDGL